MYKITQLTNQLSFSRKLALTFFLCSLLTFLVIDIIMHILYSTVVATSNSDSTFDTEAFSQFSNNEILSSAQAYLESGLDLYEQIVVQVYSTHQHFINNKQIYTSNLERGINPPLQSTFEVPKYDRTCVYFHTNTSTFYDQPYINKVLASSASDKYPMAMKRINVIYQDKQDPQDIMVFTLPATSDFYVPDSKVITSKIANSYTHIITFGDWYYDSLSKSNNESQLISLSLLVDRGTFNMLIQIEVYKFILDRALMKVYSFPNTRIFFVKLDNDEESTNEREMDGDETLGYTIMGQNAPIFPNVQLSNFFTAGSQNTTIQNSPFLVTTKAISQKGDIIQNTTTIPIPITNLRMIIFLNTSQTMLPNIIYDEFRNNEYNVLVLLLYGWTFIVMLIVFSIGVVIGDIIFSYFKLIGEKCKQYRTNPDSLKSILRDMKMQGGGSRTNNKLLKENIVSIMQGIENKKAENKRNYKINYDSYPLNRLGIGFQSRMCLKDYNKFQQIAMLIKQNQNTKTSI